MSPETTTITPVSEQFEATKHFDPAIGTTDVIDVSVLAESRGLDEAENLTKGCRQEICGKLPLVLRSNNDPGKSEWIRWTVLGTSRAACQG